jgi:hypothetical protein
VEALASPAPIRTVKTRAADIIVFFKALKFILLLLRFNIQSLSNDRISGFAIKICTRRATFDRCVR